MLKRTHFSELSTSRFTTCKRKHERSLKLHTPFPNARSEKRKLQAKNDRAMTGHKSNSEFKQIYYSFISIHYKLNLPRETDAIWTSQVHMTVENQLVNPASFANCASPRTTSHLTLINCFRTTGAK